MVRAEHGPGGKGLTAILRCLDLVLREGNYFSNCTGRIETGSVPTGLHELPCRGGCKTRGKVKLSKSRSPLLFPHWLLIEASGQRETDQLPARLLGYWHSSPISVSIAGERIKGLMLQEKNGHSI